MYVMSRTVVAVLFAGLLAVGLARAQSAGSIMVEAAFSRATPGGAKVGVGYLTIVNKGAVVDRLIAATSPAAAKVEIHEMGMDNGIMKMREIPGGLLIDPGKSVSLAPGGYHLMLMGLKAPLKQGDKVPVTLTFEKAGKVDVTLAVRGIGDMGGDHMHKM